MSRFRYLLWASVTIIVTNCVNETQAQVPLGNVSRPCCRCEVSGKDIPRCSNSTCCGIPDKWVVEGVANHRASRTLHRLAHQNDHSFSSEFREGFVQAYYDLGMGMDGVIPAVAPRKYWTAYYRSSAGRPRVYEWFDGYAMGVDFGRADGMDDIRRVASSYDWERSRGRLMNYSETAIPMPTVNPEYNPVPVEPAPEPTLQPEPEPMQPEANLPPLPPRMADAQMPLLPRQGSALPMLPPPSSDFGHSDIVQPQQWPHQFGHSDSTATTSRWLSSEFGMRNAE